MGVRVMKKMLILTVVLTLCGGMLGCRWCDRWWRGSSSNEAPIIYGAPISGCDPCAAPAAAPCAPPACGYIAPTGS